MLVTEQKPINEILETLEEDQNIFLLGCNGCAEICKTGGEAGLLVMKEELENAGKTITEKVLIDLPCNKVLVSMRLARHAKALEKVDSILVLSCGIGVQTVSKVVEKIVRPALNTISLGGFQGLWPSEERCDQCGDCVLDMTGGICPVTSCAKGLLNGPCGGALEGKCEVDSEKDCGWDRIYKKLDKIGQINNLKKFIKPRDYSKMIPSSDLRKTSYYDLEQM